MRLGKKHTATHHEQRQWLQLPKGTYWDREYLARCRAILKKNPENKTRLLKELFSVKYLKEIILLDSKQIIQTNKQPV